MKAMDLNHNSQRQQEAAANSNDKGYASLNSDFKETCFIYAQ